MLNGPIQLSYKASRRQNQGLSYKAVSDRISSFCGFNLHPIHEFFQNAMLTRPYLIKSNVDLKWCGQELYIFELQHQELNLRTCAPSEDTDQLVHSRILIRFFSGHFKRTTKTDQTVRMWRSIWVLFWRTCQKIRFLTLFSFVWNFHATKTVQRHANTHTHTHKYTHAHARTHTHTTGSIQLI